MNTEELEEILGLAAEKKKKHQAGMRREDRLGGKVVAMVFEKPSLRTKVAFEVAVALLGGIPVYLTSAQILASGNNEKGRESIPDIARNLERFADLLIARVYEHAVIEELAESIEVPLINALCDQHHPTQALADALAMREHFGKDKKLKVAYIGDGNNVATSLMDMCSLLGYDFSIASPEGFEVPVELRAEAEKCFEERGARALFLRSPKEAVQGVDVIYTDTFVSMGQEEEKASRARTFEGYQVNMDLLREASDSAIFMHCLPAHRGEEVTDEVMDCPQSIIFDQAECRLHIAKALLEKFLL